MIKLIAIAFVILVAMSAQAITPAPLWQQDSVVTQARFGCANHADTRRRGDRVEVILLRCICGLLALTGGSTMSAPTSARGGKAEMLRTAPIRRS
jgi:hypothetical protein